MNAWSFSTIHNNLQFHRVMLCGKISIIIIINIIILLLSQTPPATCAQNERTIYKIINQIKKIHF